MTDTGIIVFARLDSTRLPGKVLADLNGRPLLGSVLDRVRRVVGAPPVVVATSDRAADEAIVAFARSEGVACYRGDADDVAARALGCAEHFGFARFVRISGDSPFIPPELVTQVLELHECKRSDIATNVQRRTFPPGTSVEVISTSAMRRAVAAMATPAEREHVTLHFYRNPHAYRIDNLAADDGRYEGISLVIDTADDLERARHIGKALGNRVASTDLEEVAALARRLQRPRDGAQAPQAATTLVKPGLLR